MDRKEKVAKKFAEKSQMLMVEFMNESMSAKDRKELTDKIKKVLLKESIPVNLHTLKAFLEGIKIIMASSGNENGTQLAMMLLMGTKSMIVVRENETEKTIDAAMESPEVQAVSDEQVGNG